MTALISNLTLRFRPAASYKPSALDKNCSCTVCTSWRRNMK